MNIIIPRDEYVIIELEAGNYKGVLKKPKPNVTFGFGFLVSFLNGIMLVYLKFLGVSKVTFETAVAIRLLSALRLLLFREIPTKPTSQLEASHYVGSK